MKVLERDVETIIEGTLANLGWNDDVSSTNRTVYKQQAKTINQNKKLKNKAPDYVLYEQGTDTPLVVIEVKRPGKNLNQALKQGENYAEKIGSQIVIATDGVFYKTRFMDNKKPLFINGEEVEELLSPAKAKQFILNKSNKVTTISEKTITSRSELIEIFEESNNLLRNEGIEAGLPRFSEFVNVLFLKLISELADFNEYPHSEIPLEYRWNYFKDYNGKILLDYVNNTVMEYYKKKYGEDSLFESLTISNPRTLKNIINKLDSLVLIDINADIKGDAFEHFLKSYTSGENDLGQYFTPRHIVKLMVKIMNPKIGESVFDPFCGTGGILIECFKHIKKSISSSKEFTELLHKKTIFGSEISRTARIAKMNMILMGDGHSNIKREDSLENIKKDLYDIVITNQPFAQESDFGSLYPVPSKLVNSIGIQHSVLALKDGGRGALIVQEGVLFDKKYKNTRKWLFKNVKIEYVISLQNGVFLPYTNAKTNIIIFSNKGTSTSELDNVFFINIENDGFTLDNHREKIKGRNDIDNFVELSSDLELLTEKELKGNKIIKKSFKEIKNNQYKLIGRQYQNKIDIESQYNLVSLESLCTNIIRGPFGSAVKKSLYVDEGIKVYEQSNVINNDFYSGDYYVKEEYFNEKLKRFEIKTDDILMTCAGTLGRMAIVPAGIERGIINSVLTLFRVKKEVVLPQYFLILMKSTFMQKELLNAVGTGIKNMRPISEVKELLVPLPTIPEQKDIVNQYQEKEKERDNLANKLNELNNEIDNFDVL
ncbi:N-6 DNA methylase [Virgibacillus dakarensis]|nr:N-6 DNA methylase [Virgibacillus dakarensis]